MVLTRQCRYSFLGGLPTWLVPRIQNMIGKLLYLSFYDPNVAAAIVVAHPYPPPCFPPINDELRSDFAKTLILTSFFANLNRSRGRASIDMKHVCHSDRPLPREDSSPYSIGRVDGGFRKSIASTDSLGNYSQMTTCSVSSTRSKPLTVERTNEPWLAGCEGAGAHCGRGDFGRRQRRYAAERSWK